MTPPRRPSVLLPGLLFGALALLGVSPARAQAASERQDAAPTLIDGLDPADGATILRPSLQWGIVQGDRTSGFGLGLQYLRYPNASAWRYGLFAEAQGELDGAWRVAAGLSGGYGMFGIELGVMHRTVGDYAAVTAVHLAKTITFGPVGLAWRVGIPVATYQPAQTERLRTRGFEAGFVLSVGWSFAVRGVRPPSHCHRRHAEPAPRAY